MKILNTLKLLAMFAWEDLPYSAEEVRYITKQRRAKGLSDWPDEEEQRRDNIFIGLVCFSMWAVLAIVSISVALTL